MKSYLRNLLEWFKYLLKKLKQLYVQTLKHKPLHKKPQQSKLNGSINEFSSTKLESLDRSPTLESPLPKKGDISQELPNYPPMPQRELLVDKPFELKEKQETPSSFFKPEQKGSASNSLTSPTLPSQSKTQASSQVRRKRPYINRLTNELEYITNSEWNNPTILREIHNELQFRNRRRAQRLLTRILNRLEELDTGKPFVWPSTTAPEKAQTKDLSSYIFKHEEGLLRIYGYKVGVSGLPEKQRRQILDKVFLNALPDIKESSYLSEWGKPGTAKRLKKLADSIAAFTRNAKRRNQEIFAKAIQDWETDLAYLERTYYSGRFSFHWPQTNVNKL